MGNYRLIVLSVILAALMYVTNPFFTFESGMNKDLVDYWDREITTIKKTCKGGVRLPTNILVDFGDTDDAIGYCQKYSNGFKIVLNKNKWYYGLDDIGRRQLLLHEMCHCIFNIKHNERDENHFMYPEYIKLDEKSLLIQLEETIKSSSNCLN